MVALDGEVDAVGDEGGSVAEEMDVLVDLLDDFEGEFADEGAVGDEEDGDFFVAAADGAEDGQGRSFGELVLALEVPIQKDGAVRRVGRDQGQTVLRRRRSRSPCHLLHLQSIKPNDLRSSTSHFFFIV